MFTALIQTGCQAQDFALVKACYRYRPVKRRTAFGQCAGFVNHQRIHLAQIFNRRCIPKQHTLRSAPARRYHDRHWRSQPQRTRAGND